MEYFTHDKPLTAREERLLSFLSTSRHYQYAAASQALNMSTSSVHTYAFRIREKTGIRDTLDAEEVRAWARERQNFSMVTGARKQLSAKQVAVLRLLIKPHSHKEIARILGINEQVSMNHASIGCKRAGIRGTGLARRQAIRAYLDKLDGKKEDGGEVVTMADFL